MRRSAGPPTGLASVVIGPRSYGAPKVDRIPRVGRGGRRRSIERIITGTDDLEWPPRRTKSPASVRGPDFGNDAPNLLAPRRSHVAIGAGRETPGSCRASPRGGATKFVLIPSTTDPAGMAAGSVPRAIEPLEGRPASPAASFSTAEGRVVSGPPARVRSPRAPWRSALDHTLFDLEPTVLVTVEPAASAEGIGSERRSRGGGGPGARPGSTSTKVGRLPGSGRLKPSASAAFIDRYRRDPAQSWHAGSATSISTRTIRAARRGSARGQSGQLWFVAPPTRWADMRPGFPSAVTRGLRVVAQQPEGMAPMIDRKEMTRPNRPLNPAPLPKLDSHDRFFRGRRGRIPLASIPACRAVLKQGQPHARRRARTFSTRWRDANTEPRRSGGTSASPRGIRTHGVVWKRSGA